jgi:microcompartment protein CcmL/EutN
MDGYALGLIETRGKLAAIEAADVALKSANVALCGVENATGALITVKVVGDVGAVRAAVDAAKTRASLLGDVIATRVLPRPAAGIKPLLKATSLSASPETIVKSIDSASHTIDQERDGEERRREPEVGSEILADQEEGETLAPTPASFPSEGAEQAENVSEAVADAPQAATCNICNDPSCSREKGEPSNLCLHGKKKRKK